MSLSIVVLRYYVFSFSDINGLDLLRSCAGNYSSCDMSIVVISVLEIAFHDYP